MSKRICIKEEAMYIPQVLIGMCERQKEKEEVCSCSPIVGSLPVKMDRSKKYVYLYIA